MTKKDKKKLYSILLFLGGGIGVSFLLIRLNKYFSSPYEPINPFPGGGSGSSGLDKASILDTYTPSNSPCSWSSPIGCRTSPYGIRTIDGVTKMHWGMDIRAKPIGKKLIINTPGKVVSVNEGSGWGKRIGIKTDSGLYLLFGHLDKIFVSEGMRVYPLDIIGETGKTQTKHPHLHYEVCKDEPCDNIPGGKNYYNLYKLDPKDYLNYFYLSN